MAITDSLLPEFDQEAANTRRALERVPDDKFDWKPHPKSWSMGALASHVANLSHWAVMTLQTDSLDLNPPGGGEPPRLPVAASRQELLGMFDRNTAAAREAIAGASDARWMESWTLLNGGHALFSMPKVAVMRTFVMNHLVHHRGQLTVYLRLNDVPVPALYGPSADETGM